MRILHGELVATQEWVKASGAKICIVFEGRDTAGKGGTIKRITERVSPRVFRVVALPAPTDLKSYRCWYDYSRARDAMFAATDTDWAPWYLAHSDDKRRARLNIISHLLSQVPYKPLASHDVTLPKRQRPGGYVEPDLRLKYIPTPF
jgi:polyphosphate kinase 2 (PPK2 family)